MATKTIRFLTASQVQRLHAALVISNAVPTQTGLLESVVPSPMNLKHYAKVEDVFQLAANLAEKLMKNHAFLDGNKRTALLAADMFLKLNGYYLQKVPFAEDTYDRALSNAHVAVVNNQWTAEQLGNYYKSVARPLDSLTAEVMEFRTLATEY
ncbi:type II toxin-antitoxin system death-on-curing family toxin [Aspergillus homomorphus CBS 101889]|uniref:DOC family protein n=1 Tax=Aspergillus homomorphus (strain CBS 101889) TaxID=1450537 RepID=A0A395HN90_ASPHC|nr:DOC family protein [Aspergillus homomorphus CBS 101889]RAL09230.1 DOC family protein [Aspergillus homomorphus CBS 101889]